MYAVTAVYILSTSNIERSHLFWPIWRLSQQDEQLQRPTKPRQAKRSRGPQEGALEMMR